MVWHSWIGGVFVTDHDVTAQVGKILVPMLSLYLFTGPVLVLALYFQAIGRSGRTAALTLVKPFALSPVLLAALGLAIGAKAIWFAFPIADAIIVAVAIGMATGQGRSTGFGLSLREETP